MTISMQFETVYNPKNVEKKWYKTWEEGKYFKPHTTSPEMGAWCIIMPPPNVTGRLHAGHALDITIQDIITRFKRMKGFETLFLPGMDHAGIATQNVVEKLIYKQEKKSRHQFQREEFIKKIWQWKEEYGDIIAKQQRSMGASPDWDYSLFTMDPEANEAVKKAFVELYNQGLIYQSDYIVNWDPQLQSAISDAEVEYKEIQGAFYHIRYFLENSKEYVEIATTRPETLLGDTAVSVHPEDSRYQHLIGKNAIVPLCNRKIPIIADTYVDKEKGTGCLKVTPGHDFNDFEIGVRHNLPIINILNGDGTINQQGLEFKDLMVKTARKKIIAQLKEKGVLVKVKPHIHQVGHGDRTGAIIEPLVSKQWFLNVQEMAKVAVKKIEDGSTKFFPKNWENTYFSWLKNPKNWCLSRQLWWGHRIPVFQCTQCQHQWASVNIPTCCPKCNSSNIEQDPDVLDTWFSSSLWPFSTLGWPDQQRMKEKKFDTFFPSSCLVTGYDIIFFWVARMMMMSLKFFDTVPFHHIYIHAIVRDKLGRKMSKSLNNGIDPIEMVEIYGSDAFRFTLASGSGYNRGLNLDPKRIDGYRNFINKIWNAFRFIHPTLKETNSQLPPLKNLSHHEKWILSELNETIRIINEKIEEYRYDEACSAIYSFVYDKFCSWFIEISKESLKIQSPSKKQRTTILKYTFGKIMALLHPFTPFITEELWSYLKNSDDDLLIVQKYPEYSEQLSFPQDQLNMKKFIEIITAIRNLKADFNIRPKEMIDITISTDEKQTAQYLQKYEKLLTFLTHGKTLALFSQRNIKRPLPSLFKATSHSDIFISLQGIDLSEQKKRLERERHKIEKELAKYEKKLSNEKFIDRAPQKIILQVKSDAKELKAKINSINESLNALT